jgi:hypothetical protein
MTEKRAATPARLPTHRGVARGLGAPGARLPGEMQKSGKYLFPEGMPLSTPKKQFDAAVSYSPTLSELIEACHQDGVCMRLIERPDGTWITSRG